ncbi:MAG: hypothetical protein KDA44_22325, partial [Planctomycetales bacterium]|nr:hypothetical protein [Planctomycetales bacterium]
DLQAYRTDRFTGWTRQPSEIGPVLFTSTSPTYVDLAVIGGDSGGVGVTGLVIGGVVVLLLLAAATVVLLKRRSSVDDRE